MAKDSLGPEANGTVDEACAVLGMARALASDEIHDAILAVQRELFVVGAELATAPERRGLLTAGTSLVTSEMVVRLEAAIDAIEAARGMPTEFIVPGGNPLAAALDVARTVVRRAERRAVTHVRAAGLEDSLIVSYLNRLADYLYMLARSAETAWVPSRTEETR